MKIEERREEEAKRKKIEDRRRKKKEGKKESKEKKRRKRRRGRSSRGASKGTASGVSAFCRRGGQQRATHFGQQKIDKTEQWRGQGEASFRATKMEERRRADRNWF